MRLLCTVVMIKVLLVAFVVILVFKITHSHAFVNAYNATIAAIHADDSYVFL